MILGRFLEDLGVYPYPFWLVCVCLRVHRSGSFSSLYGLFAFYGSFLAKYRKLRKKFYTLIYYVYGKICLFESCGKVRKFRKHCIPL